MATDEELFEKIHNITARYQCSDYECDHYCDTTIPTDEVYDVIGEIIAVVRQETGG